MNTTTTPESTTITTPGEIKAFLQGQKEGHAFGRQECLIAIDEVLGTLGKEAPNGLLLAVNVINSLPAIPAPV